MKFPYLHIPFYFGMAAMLAGTVFRLQHWQGGSAIVFGSMVLQAVFYLLAFIEIITSKKAVRSTRIITAAYFVLFPAAVFTPFPLLLVLVLSFLTGTSYLSRYRSTFIFTKKEMEKPQFDSI